MARNESMVVLLLFNEFLFSRKGIIPWSWLRVFLVDHSTSSRLTLVYSVGSFEVTRSTWDRRITRGLSRYVDPWRDMCFDGWLSPSCLICCLIFWGVISDRLFVVMEEVGFENGLTMHMLEIETDQWTGLRPVFMGAASARGKLLFWAVQQHAYESESTEWWCVICKLRRRVQCAL